MEFLLNPNVAYILLVVGTVLLMMAILTPGTHVLEGGALLLLILAGYGVYNLGFSPWALIVLVLSLVPFVFATRKPGREPWLALSLLGLIVGSVYLFPSEGFLPAVNPFLAVGISLLAAGFTWLVVGKGVQAHHARPLQDLERLIGQVGQAKTEVREAGSVQVASELWSARSEKAIPAGSRVRVVARDGFTLLVERENGAKK